MLPISENVATIRSSLAAARDEIRFEGLIGNEAALRGLAALDRAEAALAEIEATISKERQT